MTYNYEMSKTVVIVTIVEVVDTSILKFLESKTESVNLLVGAKLRGFDGNTILIELMIVPAFTCVLIALDIVITFLLTTQVRDDDPIEQFMLPSSTLI